MKKGDQPQSKKNTQSLAFDIVEIKPFSPNPKPPISTLTFTKTNHKNPQTNSQPVALYLKMLPLACPHQINLKNTPNIQLKSRDVACTAGNPCLNVKIALTGYIPSTLSMPM